MMGGPQVPRRLGTRLSLTVRVPPTHTQSRWLGSGPSVASRRQDGPKANPEIKLCSKALATRSCGTRNSLHFSGYDRSRLRDKITCFILPTWRVLTQPAFCPPVRLPPRRSLEKPPRPLARSCCNAGTEGWAGRGPAQGHTAGKGVRPAPAA